MTLLCRSRHRRLLAGHHTCFRQITRKHVAIPTPDSDRAIGNPRSGRRSEGIDRSDRPLVPSGDPGSSPGRHVRPLVEPVETPSQPGISTSSTADNARRSRAQRNTEGGGRGSASMGVGWASELAPLRSPHPTNTSRGERRRAGTPTPSRRRQHTQPGEVSTSSTSATLDRRSPTTAPGSADGRRRGRAGPRRD